MRFAPPAPRPGSRRGREHAQQRNDVNTDGYFVERFFSYPFGSIAPGASAEVNMRIMSMGSRYVVCPAIRARLISTNKTLTGLELGLLRLRLKLNALDDWINDGQGGNTASLGALFAQQPSPWFWFSHPHRLRAGDNLIATITNAGTNSETFPTLVPELVLRMMDADIYWDLYGKLVDVAQATDEELLNGEPSGEED